MIALLSLILTLFEEYTLGNDFWRVSCYSDGWFHFRPISFPVEISENYSPITDMTCGRFICDLLLPNSDHIFAIKRCIHVPTWLLCNGGFFAWSAPSHYLNQCWSIVYLTLRNKIHHKEMHLNMSFAIFRPFCLDLNVFKFQSADAIPHIRRQDMETKQTALIEDIN